MEEEGKDSGVIKELATQRIKRIIASLALKALPYILIAALVIIVLAVIIRFIVISNGSYKDGDETNIPYLVDSEIDKLLDEKQNVTIVKDAIGGGYHYDIDLDELVKNIMKKAEDNRTVLNTYISRDKQKEYLKAFIKAQLVTQSFNLGNTGENDFNGAIKVKKQKSDGSEEWLTYIDNETFESYVKSGDDNVFKHFTLNPSGQLVVAQSQRETTTVDTNIQGMDTSGEQQYSISETSLDYKAMLDNYVMPFDLLWALLVKCTEQEFVYEVANLAINSEIIITAYENSTTTVQTEETNYDLKEIHNMTVEGETNSRVETRVTEDLNSQKYYVHKTTTINTNNVVLNITYADVWIAKYINDYSSEPVDSSSESQDETRDENYNITIPARNVPLGSSYANLEASVCKDSERVTKHIVTSQLRKRGANYKINTTGNSYKEGPTNIEEKTDKDSETENFVTLLKKYPQAERKIMDAPSWLFDMMKSSQETADMIDLMKYLLYKATGVDLGVTSLEQSLFGIKKLTSMYAGGGINVNKTSISREDFIECIKNYRSDSGYQTRFAQYADRIYDICVSKNINPILCAAQAGCESGFGSKVPSNSRWNYWGLAVYNNSNTGKAFNNIDEAISYYCDTILSYQKPGSLAYSKAQLYAPYNDKITGNMSSIYDVFCAYMFLGERHDGRMWDGVNVKKYLVEYLHFNCTHGLNDSTTLEEQAAYVVDYLDNHLISTAKDMFGTKIYSGDSIIEAADIIHKYMEQNNYTYCVYGSNSHEECSKNGKSHGLNRTFEESKTGHHNTCCATYVSWVLQMAGYIDDSDHSDGAIPLAESILIKKYGWKTVSIAEMQEGDVLYFKYGHIEIYAGNNSIYNAGSGGAIRGQSPHPAQIPSSAIVLRAP